MHSQTNPLRAARAAARLTALELAIRSGSTEMRVYSLERGRGRAHADEAQRIAKALNVKPTELFPKREATR